MATPFEIQPHGNEIAPFEAKADKKGPRRRLLGRALAPILDRGRKTALKKELQEQQELNDLAGQVTKKALAGIEEHGMVVITKEAETGNFTTGIFKVFFSSPSLPRLEITVEKHDKRPAESWLDFEREMFGGAGDRISLRATEEIPNKFAQWDRHIAIRQSWDMDDTDFEITSGRGLPRDDTAPLSHEEKTRFLREILDTEVDIPATEAYFNSNYTSRLSSWDSVHTGYTPHVPMQHSAHMMRDIKPGQLPALTGGVATGIKPLTE